MPRGPRGVNARHVPLAMRREMIAAVWQGLETEAISPYLMDSVVRLSLNGKYPDIAYPLSKARDILTVPLHSLIVGGCWKDLRAWPKRKNRR
jgi:hypothetical protein